MSTNIPTKLMSELITQKKETNTESTKISIEHKKLRATLIAEKTTESIELKIMFKEMRN